MEATTTQGLLSVAWFGLIGLMMALYVITDGFDLGVGILCLFRRDESDRNLMIQSIGHVWDANETWLVVLGGALFGAFPAAYATLLSDLYVPVMVLIASLIMRGAAVEFRHAAQSRKGLWDRIFGLGSLLAAASQGIILGKVITGMVPGAGDTAFVFMTALGVVSGYALLGSTWLVGKTAGHVQHEARKSSVISVLTTVACAVAVSIGTLRISPIGLTRWAEPHVLHLLIAFAVVAALAFCYVLYAVFVGSERGPFHASIVMFLATFAGLVVSLFPDIVPGQLTIASAASNTTTLVFMLFGIGTMLPIMIGYNLYQYHLFRGKVVAVHH